MNAGVRWDAGERHGGRRGRRFMMHLGAVRPDRPGLIRPHGFLNLRYGRFAPVGDRCA